jgi:hypothetical protein
MVVSVHTNPKARVWCDDREITHDCFWADDVAGLALGYARNSDGRFYMTHPDVLGEREWRGTIRIELPQPADA